MGSRIPYSQSSGYLGLLNSEHESVLNGNFLYESFHSGASEIPPFSSQQSEAPTPPEDTPAERGKRQKWTPADDEVLISAWLNTSKNAIVGNEQKLQNFWKRVGEYFAASPHGTDGGAKREHKHLKQRWHKINDLTNKFCGAYAAAERQNCSGQNENDVLNVAHDIFYSDHKIKFNLEHAWCVLRYDQKWLNLNPPKASGSSKRKDCVEGSQASVNVGDNETRPEGIKAAKARRNTTQGKTVDEYKSIWEMKKEDLTMKEKLSKLAILDALLAKKNQLSDPLSEAEEIYSQPSESEEYGGETSDNIYSETEDLIHRNQAEIRYNYGELVQYPPQPDVEFGFPLTCYCGSQPVLATSYTRNDPGRRYYTVIMLMMESAMYGNGGMWRLWRR
uniref:Myb-like domain-containing protein n=1 Tax=Brassica oleracea var. oleracea TaxID=109376 RepID=A0A0D3E330_BRAOL